MPIEFNVNGFAMALSKPAVKALKPKVMDKYLLYKCDYTVSIDVIYGKIASAANEYICILPDHAKQIYDYGKKQLTKDMEEINFPILVFEERNGPLTDVVVFVLHEKACKGSREHIQLHTILHHRLQTFPNVSFVRRFDFTGK